MRRQRCSIVTWLIFFVALTISFSNRVSASEFQFRRILDYDISHECEASVSNMIRGISEGLVIPARDIPECIQRDTNALEYLNDHWLDAERATADACLAAFAKANPTPGEDALKYSIISFCIGRKPND